jgi:Tfp pilus assembly PilM family ATPase
MIWWPKIAGIEVGTRTVKLALVRTGPGGRAARVLALIEQEIVQRDNETRTAATVRALTDALEQLKSPPDVYVSHIPGRNAVVRVLSVPFKNPRVIGATIKGELEPHVPLPIDDLVADFAPIGTTDGKTEVLTVAVRKSSLQEHLEPLTEAGIDPEVVDLDVASLTALWLRENPVRDGEVTVLVHASHDGSLLAVLEGRKLLFLRGMDFSAIHLEKDGQHIAEQILTTLRAFAATSKKTDIGRLVFTGTNLTSAQCTAFERTLGLNVSVWQLGQKLSVPNDAANDSSWAAVIGNAVNYATGSRVGFNFRKEEFAPHAGVANVKKHVVFSGVLAILLLVVGAARLRSEVRAKVAERDALDSAIVQVFENTFPEAGTVPPGKVLPMLQSKQSPVAKRQEEYDMYRPYLPGRTRTLDVLREVITLIPNSQDLLVKELSLNRGVLTVAGHVGNWNDVELIRQQLDNSELLGAVRVTVQTENRQTRKTDFEIAAEQL